jgi:cell wall-associated NlpC family hydrolase
MAGDVELLARAHSLFTDPDEPGVLMAGRSPALMVNDHAGATSAAYQSAAASRTADVRAAGEVDAEFNRIYVRARLAHEEAYRDTGSVLAAARADAATAVGNPIAARELLRRRIARLRSQRAHVLAARRRARRRRSDLRALRYRLSRRRRPGDRRADVAVRAALSRIGRPYVWGATGPDRFDCSGLVQWAYAQAGTDLRRTTYQQIQDGLPVSPSQVRPGDLVFPHTGHVQMAIGNNLVVEAPQPGATVQITRMGPSVAIRRPV